MSKHTLIEHAEIQNWVHAHKGQPAISRVPDSLGTVRARLTLSFAKHKRLTATPSQDDGMSPCSWTAWLAELDRQHLALKVSDPKSTDFELIDRRNLN